MRREHFIALALHRRILLHARRDPQKVRTIAQRNVLISRTIVRGQRNLLILRTWESAISRGDLILLSDLCLREDAYGIEARKISPFAGVLSQGERLSILMEARSQWDSLSLVRGKVNSLNVDDERNADHD